MSIQTSVAGTSAKSTSLLQAVFAVALGLFIVAMVPHVEVANLFDIPASEAKGASTFLPFGYVGVWAAIPYAIWFFLAVEGVPLAAEETKKSINEIATGVAQEATLRERVERTSLSEDFAEGRAAFAERRQPVFQGQ